ncbi:MAG: hypothetical protein WDM71_02725 [Ferruginibacter sp.]
MPTLDNADSTGGGATLDTIKALQEGFKPSSKASPNPNPNSPDPNAKPLHDVWTKGWTEVTFDLSPYRGQQITLTFEADNCVPGGHFSYAYVALRNTCAGLLISGDTSACYYSNITYSVPALMGANYQWMVPDSWTIVSGDTTNIINVIAGTKAGNIIAEEQNSCADLKDTLAVTTTQPSVGGNVSGNNTVCAGSNNSILLLNNNIGNVLQWLSSSDGNNWNNIADTNAFYAAKNITNTTLYAAIVQTGKACPADTSSAATITVDQKVLQEI